MTEKKVVKVKSEQNDRRQMSKRIYLMRRSIYQGIPQKEIVSKSEKISELIESADNKPLKEFDALKDTYMRLRADFDNYRKRVDREKKDIIERANEDILKEIITSLDQFELALKATGNLPENDSFVQGMKLIYEHLVTILKNKGLAQIESAGKHFDPHYHEAVAVEQNNDVKDNHITAVLREGYIYKNKVIRPAMVKVARNS